MDLENNEYGYFLIFVFYIFYHCNDACILVELNT